MSVRKWNTVDFDTAWYLSVNDFARHTPWLHGIAAAYALWAGLAALAVLLVSAWWNARREPRPHDRVTTTVLTGTSTIVSLVANQVLISPVFARPRPCRDLPGVEVLLKCATDYSMPSDHCIIAGAFVAGLWLTGRGYGAVATVLAIPLAFARVYVGVHYPLDTLAGLGTGAAICTAMVCGLRHRATTVVNILAANRLRPLITSAPRPVSSHRSPAPLGQ